MSPACALLDDDVRLVANTGEKTPGGVNMSCSASFFKPVTAEEIARRSTTPKTLMDCVEDGSVRLVVDAPLKPLEIYTASLHLPATPREIVAELQAVRVVAADGNLVVLTTGAALPWIPASGEYLVYDARAEALVLAPAVDWGKFKELFITRRVVLCRHDGESGEFSLVLLLLCCYTGKPFVLVWRSSTSTFSTQEANQCLKSPRCYSSVAQGRWEQREARLPGEDLAHRPFSTDEAFCFRGRWACWFDLGRGMIMCDMSSHDLDCHFTPLPEMTWLRMSGGLPEVYSTVGVVDGEMIKLLFMDGFDDERVPRDQVTVRTFTLSMDGRTTEWVWNEEEAFRVAEIWTDESFLAIPGLPKCAPMCPVLSPKEPGMVYFFVSDIGVLDDGHMGTRGEYVLGIDIRTKKVKMWRKCATGRSYNLVPSYIATEFPGQPPSSNLDDQGVRAAGEPEEP